VQDVLLVSSFGLWAMVIGFAAGADLAPAGELKRPMGGCRGLIRGSTAVKCEQSCDRDFKIRAYRQPHNKQNSAGRS